MFLSAHVLGGKFVAEVKDSYLSSVQEMKAEAEIKEILKKIYKNDCSVTYAAENPLSIDTIEKKNLFVALDLLDFQHPYMI